MTEYINQPGYSVYPAQFQQPVTYVTTQPLVQSQVIQSRVIISPSRIIQQPQSPTKQLPKGGFENICVWLLPLILGIIGLIASLNLLNNLILPTPELIGANKVMKHIFDNLRSNTIIHITQQQTDDATCPTGEDKLQVGDWHGIDSGCLCDDGRVIDTTKCITNSRCRYVSSIDQQKVWKWTQKTYCAQKNQNWNRRFMCDQGEVKCANDLCVAGGEKCPDNSITHESAQDVANQLAQNLFATQNPSSATIQNIQFDLTDTNTLYKLQFEQSLNANSANRPFLKLTVSSGTDICYNPLKAPALISARSYPLLDQKYTGCDRYGAYNSKYVETLDYQLMTEYFRENAIGNNDLNSSVAFWEAYQDAHDRVYLLAEKKIEILPGNNQKVCEAIEGKVMDQVSSNQVQSTRVIQVTGWIEVFLSSFIILASAYLFWVLYKNVEDNKLTVLKATIVLGLVIVVTTLIACIFYYVIVHRKLDAACDSLSAYDKARCFEDGGVGLAIREIAKYHNEKVAVCDKSFIAYIVAICIYVVGWALLLYIKNKRQQESQNPAQ